MKKTGNTVEEAEGIGGGTCRGRVTKAYNSYYYVATDDGCKDEIVCTLRGRFKKEMFLLLVGDEVIFAKTGRDTGVIEEILPRGSLMKRPLAANVNHAVIVFAAAEPEISTGLLDQFLVLAEQSQIQASICINKIDLGDLEKIGEVADRYRNIGYRTLLVSAKALHGITELKEVLKDKVSVFSGPSGVGKSTVLNAVEPQFGLKTSQVSKKIGRGRHTTRFAELLKLSDGGFVVDTPGFSFAEFDDMEENELMYCFPEFLPVLEGCRFNSCLHFKEPDCKVKEAVEDGLIFPERYCSYVDILCKIREKRKVY